MLARGKMEHILGIGTTVKGCQDSEKVLDVETLDEIRAELTGMDKKLNLIKTKKKVTTEEATSLTLPKRQKQSTLGVKVCSKNSKLEMDYTRLVVMTTCRTNFMESDWGRPSL